MSYICKNIHKLLLWSIKKTAHVWYQYIFNQHLSCALDMFMISRRYARLAYTRTTFAQIQPVDEKRNPPQLLQSFIYAVSLPHSKTDINRCDVYVLVWIKSIQEKLIFKYMLIFWRLKYPINMFNYFIIICFFFLLVHCQLLKLNMGSVWSLIGCLQQN